MNYTDKTKTLRLDSTLSQELSKLQAIINTTWLSHCHLRRQSRAGSFSHTGEWNRTGYPKFCVVRTVFFSLALIDILVGLVVQSALLEKSTCVFFLLLLLFCFVFFLLFCFFVVGFLFFFHCRAEIVCEELSLTTLSLFASVLCYWLFPVSTLTAWQKLGLKQFVVTVWAVWIIFIQIFERIKGRFCFSPTASGLIGFSLVLNIALPFTIFKIIRCHERQIHTHKVKSTWRFTRVTIKAVPRNSRKRWKKKKKNARSVWHEQWCISRACFCFVIRYSWQPPWVTW